MVQQTNTFDLRKRPKASTNHSFVSTIHFGRKR